MMKYILILLLLLPIAFSQDYVKIKYFYTPKDMVVERGKSNESLVILENTHNETIYMIRLKYEIPSGLFIEQKEIEELSPNQRKSIRFNLTANVGKGDYNITIWAESIDEINGNKIQSPKYTFKVKVLDSNVTQSIGNTTTTEITSTTTTTTFYETTTAFQTTTTLPSKPRIPSNIKFVLVALLILALIFLFIIMMR